MKDCVDQSKNFFPQFYLVQIKANIYFWIYKNYIYFKQLLYKQLCKNKSNKMTSILKIF